MGIYRNILFLSLLFLARIAFSDPSTEVLLNSGTTAPEDTPKSGLESGRYQKKQNVPDEEIVYGTKKPGKKITKKPASVEEDDQKDFESAPDVMPEKLPEKPLEAPPQEPTMKDQVKDLFLKGGADKTGEIYKEQIHPDDVRNNRIEIDFASGLVYNNSDANIAYRRSYSMAPDLSIGARIWLTPLVGISGKYVGTFGEAVASATIPANYVAAKSEWSELSIDLRTFFGLSRRANSLNYGLYYREYSFDVPSNETSRVKLKSSGLGLSLGGRFPTAPSYAWIMGGEIMPYVAHHEIQTGLSYTSGDSCASSLVGIYFGGEIKFSRQQQIIWTLGARMERNQFTGSASLPDPITGTTPSGVSVTNSWAFFNLGYRWGQ